MPMLYLSLHFIDSYNPSFYRINTSFEGLSSLLITSSTAGKDFNGSTFYLFLCLETTIYLLVAISLPK